MHVKDEVVRDIGDGWSEAFNLDNGMGKGEFKGQMLGNLIKSNLIINLC